MVFKQKLQEVEKPKVSPPVRGSQPTPAARDPFLFQYDIHWEPDQSDECSNGSFVVSLERAQVADKPDMTAAAWTAYVHPGRTTPELQQGFHGLSGLYAGIRV